jgi:hypothetical protein
MFEIQMYPEPANRQIPHLRINNLQARWRRGFSNGVPKAGGVDGRTREALIKAGRERKARASKDR